MKLKVKSSWYSHINKIWVNGVEFEDAFEKAFEYKTTDDDEIVDIKDKIAFQLVVLTKLVQKVLNDDEKLELLNSISDIEWERF